MVDRTLEFYTNLYLQDDILMKVDRATMMCSLESRAVFLDNDLVRILPPPAARASRLRDGTRKYLLQKGACAGILPRRTSSNRPKKGFGIPDRALAALDAEGAAAGTAGGHATWIASARPGPSIAAGRAIIAFSCGAGCRCNRCLIRWAQ